MFCNVWLAESSRAPTLWRHDHNVDDQNMAVFPIVGGRLAMLTEENVLSIYNVYKMKDLQILGRYDSSCNNAPFLIKLGSPKLHFYRIFVCVTVELLGSVKDCFS